MLLFSVKKKLNFHFLISLFSGIALLHCSAGSESWTLFQVPWISLVGKVVAVTFTVHGFNVFIVNIMGNYVLTYESGIPKYTVDPKKVRRGRFA